MVKNIKEYSIPLILGVVVSLVCANLAPHLYHEIVHTPLIGKDINLHWLVNDLFMVLFFASAGIEIVNSLAKGGPLNPIKKAVTPLMATIGGVLGPTVVFLLLNLAMGEVAWTKGWGIATATDIALAWLVAKVVFGRKHPAVSFLLLLAVADDAIGLMIIAIFYPDPSRPVEPLWLMLVLVAMIIAAFFHKKKVPSFWPYIIICGAISWAGMYLAGIHPALSMVVIVPFLQENRGSVPHLDRHGVADAKGPSPLERFERGVNPIVDFGLFFFGFTNAGVSFSGISNLTWIVMIALIVGKTFGITFFAWISTKFLKCDLPEGMKMRDIPIAGIIAGMGLTVALFVAQAAFTDSSIQGAAKMGALFSVAAGIIAVILAKIFRVERKI